MGPVTIAFSAMAATMPQDKAEDVPVAPPAITVSPPAPPVVQAPRGPNLPPSPRTRPNLVMSRDDYPFAALRENRSGDTKVELAISRWGTVADCRVTNSSGHVDLDTAACDRLVGRLRFWPATDGEGKPIAGTHSLTVRWALPETIAAPPEGIAPPIVSVSMPDPTELFPQQPRAKSYAWNRVRDTDWPAGAIEAGRSGKARVSFDIDAAGKVIGCRVLQTSGHADFDARSCAIVRERAEFTPARGIDGLAVAGRGEQVFDWKRPEPRVSPPAPNSPDAAWRTRPLVLPPFMGRPGEVTVRLTLGDDGKATTCAVEAKGGLVGVSAMENSFCKDAREKGFRTLDAVRNPLPQEIEARLNVEVKPRK